MYRVNRTHDRNHRRGSLSNAPLISNRFCLPRNALRHINSDFVDVAVLFVLVICALVNLDDEFVYIAVCVELRVSVTSVVEICTDELVPETLGTLPRTIVVAGTLSPWI